MSSCTPTAVVTAAVPSAQCSGRSQLKEPAFGGDFLFLTRDLERAKVIREAQKPLLAERSSIEAAADAVATANLKALLAGSGESPMSWPTQKMSISCFNALLQLFLGSQPLEEDEVGRLLDCVAAYRRRERAVKANIGPKPSGVLGDVDQVTPL